MTAKYIDSGDYFTGTAGSDLDPGAVVFDDMGRAGIITALNGVKTGAKYKAQATGRYELPAASADTWSAGAVIYWDGSELTDTAADNDAIGLAEAAKSAGETVAQILLNGQGPSA
jgi:predicted RecA/RadA family phage recombinase